MTELPIHSVLPRLLAAFALPEAIFSQDPAALAQVVGKAQADALGKEPPGFAPQLEATQAWLEQRDAPRGIVTLGDPDYPAALLAIEDPPLMLYRMGRLEAAPLVYITDKDLFAAIVDVDFAEICITSAATLVEPAPGARSARTPTTCTTPRRSPRLAAMAARRGGMRVTGSRSRT